ncbi:MAG: cadmium-translocating P-type ATPase, partial [Clostridia bacterium]|nr:cadmium-translocating P-type ATPase [Clostridia bacterium]
MTKKQKKLLLRILIACGLFAAVFAAEKLTDWNRYLYLVLYLIPYLTAGYDVLLKSARNICKGQVFDEMFLMAVATLGALAIGEYPECVFVMVFFQTGELFQSVAVGKSRRSISGLMDLRPDTATIVRDGAEEEALPEEVCVGDTLLVRPGERIPVDGTVSRGTSTVDTSALTGESVPADVGPGDGLISGTVNLTGTLYYTATKEYGESTAAKILELVENSSLNKAKSEKFLTRFAKYYTPSVVIGAVLLAVIPSLITGDWKEWIGRALIFLVVSCPCALVISVPLSFFGGIGGASAKGILIKGSNYLEALADVKTAVFDKTGTLTTGSFTVTNALPAEGCDRETLLSLTACAEYYSDHPIALSIKKAAGAYEPPTDTKALSGYGIEAVTPRGTVLAGNAALLRDRGVAFAETDKAGTAVYAALDGRYLGCVIINDTLKPGAAEALRSLKALGVTKTVMLTGDREAAARTAAEQAGVDEYRAGLLPQDKVAIVDELCRAEGKRET